MAAAGLPNSLAAKKRLTDNLFKGSNIITSPTILPLILSIVMSSLSSLLPSCAILLLSYCLFLSLSPHADGVVHENHHHVLSVDSLLPRDSCSSSKDFISTGLKVAHRHGPCSPLSPPKKLDHKLILDQDQSRVAALQHRRTSAAATTSHRDKHRDSLAATIPATDGNSLGTGNYIVTIGFGTPSKKNSLVFDTGSDVTWIQCQPCVSSCYQQKDPIFDPTQSSTYSNISCTSPFCSQLSTSGCSGSGCLYAVQYGDNSLTVGFYAQDTLTLTPSDVIPKFRFGCGEKNSGTFGQADGLLGLGRSPVSLPSQTSQKYGGVFSYCIPSTSSSTGYLSFGPGSSPPNAKLTPLLTDANNPSFYFLNLIGISVKGQKLSIPPTVFSTAGTIIDSGTVISRLPPAAYSALRTAFRNEMKQYPTAPALSILDTCYDLSSYNSVTLPAVVFLFSGGSTVSLDASGILYVASAKQACLGFAGNSDATDLGIYGNTQQRTFGIVYDVSKKVVGFGPGGCS